MKNLTSLQRRFVEAYAGNATEAAAVAGYSGKTAASQGQRLLKNVEVAAAIRSRESKAIQPFVTSRIERQEFWARVMRDESEDMHHRLKASEYAAKADGDFLERVELNGTLNLAQELEEARKRAGR